MFKQLKIVEKMSCDHQWEVLFAHRVTMEPTERRCVKCKRHQEAVTVWRDKEPRIPPFLRKAVSGMTWVIILNVVILVMVLASAGMMAKGIPEGMKTGAGEPVATKPAAGKPQ